MNNNYLTEIRIKKSQETRFPFSLDIFKNGLEIKLDKPITFILGDNGTGKSTFLESLAYNMGFNILGGNKNHVYKNDEHFDNLKLAEKMQLVWKTKTTKGFFFRAESFFNFTDYIEKMAEEFGRDVFGAYGGKSLLKQSHGEAFLSLFNNKFTEGIFLLDEPEAALSAEKQLALISLLLDLTEEKKCQFIIATHSPLLIAVPNADIYEISDGQLEKKEYYETKQFMLYKNFINAPERILNYLR